MRTLGAPIVSLVHPDHISSLHESRRHGDTLVVVVNGDGFLTLKKGRPFQDLETRCLIVSAITGVDFVIPYETETDMTVSTALRVSRPDVFTKGGDQVDQRTIPEWETCDELGIEIVLGVGDDKRWSSSWFLSAWAEHHSTLPAAGVDGTS
jgi:bifunctional ADP-heptose synthase (sugar kinase/adenylyltransferase)